MNKQLQEKVETINTELPFDIEDIYTSNSIKLKATKEKSATNELSLPLEEIEKLDENTQPIYSIGKYGHLGLSFLQENHPSRITYLTINNKLYETLQKVNNQAIEYINTLEKELKNKNQAPTTYLELTQYNTQIRIIAEELALKDIVFNIISYN